MLLHAINPIVFLCMYLFTTKLELKGKEDYIRRLFMAPVLFVAYMIFDLLRKLCVGTYIYGLIPNDIHLFWVMMVGIIAYFVEVAMTYGLVKLKKFTESKLK